MKIQQKPQFQPITLVLETSEEADWLWALVEGEIDHDDRRKQEFYTALSNWFSTQAQLGG